MLKLFRFLKPKFWLIIIIFLMIGAQSFSQLMLPSLMGEIVANITGPTGADNSFILRKGLEMIAYAGATIIVPADVVTSFAFKAVG